MGVSVLRTWACQRVIHSPISNLVCWARGCLRGTAPAVVKAERSAVNGNGCPTPVSGGYPCIAAPAGGCTDPALGGVCGYMYIAWGECPLQCFQPSSTLVVLGHKRVPRSVIKAEWEGLLSGL